MDSESAKITFSLGYVLWHDYDTIIVHSTRSAAVTSVMSDQQHEVSSISRFRIRSTWVKRRNALDKFTSSLSRDRLGENCQMRTQQFSADYLCFVGWQGLKRHLIADMLLIQFITTNFINLA